jgi:3-oxoacyl-[acyl-carrier-protein] synthase II
LFKDNKNTSYGIKASCCDGFRCSSPIGNNVEEYWNALINGVSGAALITYFDPANLELILHAN